MDRLPLVMIFPGNRAIIRGVITISTISSNLNRKMKSAPDQEINTKPNPRAKSLKGWVGFLSVVYRIILIIGLVLFAAAAVLIFFTRRAYLWVVPIPLGLIALGVLLAHFEYRLYRRLHYPQDQESNQNE